MTTAVQQVPKLGPYMASQIGMRGAMHVASFIAAWGIAYEDLHLGRAISIDEYAVYWGQSRAKAFRDYQRYKEIWPRDFSPLRVWKWCVAQGVQASEGRDVAAAGIFNVSAAVA